MSRRKLIDYVPHYYNELLESREILSAEDAEIAKLNASIDDLLLQFNVSTATWGLREWERICGVETDDNKPLEERRSVIKSKLRGYGVTTVDHIKNVTESFNASDAEIEEHFDTYTIVVKFFSNRNASTNMDDVVNALWEIVPAHLKFSLKNIVGLRVGTNYGVATQSGQKVMLRPKMTTELKGTATTYTASTVVSGDVTTLYPNTAQ